MIGLDALTVECRCDRQFGISREQLRQQADLVGTEVRENDETYPSTGRHRFEKLN